MRPKSNPNTLKILFISAQIFLLVLIVGILLWVMAVGYKEDVVALFNSKIDHAAETMVSQLKSNQVPSSLGTEEFGVFIVNQNDGVVIVDKHAGTGAQEEEWQRYRSKLIYEMQKQKRGWTVYPEKKPWDVRQKQRVIRYLSIDELGWILAVEASQPSDLQILRQTFKKSTYIFILGLVLCGALVIWVLNERYFYLIWRSITDTVENNFMSLSGEDSIWDKFKTTTRSTEDLEKEALGLGGGSQPHTPQSSENVSVVPVPAMESLRPPEPHEVFRPIELSVDEPKQVQVPDRPVQEEKQIVDPSHTPDKSQEKEPGQLTINVNEIKSQALKKIIKQFREK